MKADCNVIAVQLADKHHKVCGGEVVVKRQKQSIYKDRERERERELVWCAAAGGGGHCKSGFDDMHARLNGERKTVPRRQLITKYLGRLLALFRAPANT